MAPQWKTGGPADLLMASFFVDGKLDKSSKPAQAMVLDSEGLFSNFLDPVISSHFNKHKKSFINNGDDDEIRRDLVNSIRGVAPPPAIEENKPIGKIIYTKDEYVLH